jgi:uncharacterized membrane protein
MSPPEPTTRRATRFVVTTVVGGLLVIVPAVLAVGVLAKLLAMAHGAFAPLANALPAWLPFGELLALLLVVGVCFVAGLIVQTQVGRRMNRWFEDRVLQRFPGYTMFRTLARRVAGEEEGLQFAPALAEIEDALVPAFIVEQHADGRITVFVPAVPTPTVGAVYILARERVHPVDVPMTIAVKCVTRWGSGSGALLAAMRP